MSAQLKPLSTAVLTEVLKVVQQAFHYRGDFKSLLLNAGVPSPIYSRYDTADNAKVKIARFVLDELRELGETGWRIQHKIVAELCAMDRPANDVADPKAGKAALAQLRRVATESGIVVDSEQATIDARRAREERRQKQIQQRRATLGELSRQFTELHATKDRTHAELQARGYALEKLLRGLFQANDLDYEPSRQNDGEQVDGSFFFRGFTYLVEARWVKDKPTPAQLADFKLKVDGKLESTRGLYVSMAGFEEDVLDRFVSRSLGRPNIIFMSGLDLALIFGGTVELVDALLAKINAAESRGKFQYDLTA
ncbi:hypothetical protein ACFYT3_31795 [Nocardia amikacinitolerans]|uniref:hypothetical protein n=1 Tax=Nocardia amikacinitolerans TaxID=756689 RepID=UPI0036CDEEB4